MEAFLEQYGCTRDANICIISSALIAIITLIVIPFCIYYTVQIHRWRYDRGIVHRYPTTLILSSVLNILYILIVIQYMLITRGISPAISIWFAPIIANPYLLIIILLALYRLWLINYDINHKIITSRESWQSKLCSTVNDDEWYLRNGQTWGSWRWLTKILVSLWLFLSIICITPLFLSRIFAMNVYENTADIAFSSTVILSLVVAIGIIYKMPTFEDTHHILKEIKILITSSVILCVIWFSLIFWSEEGNMFNIVQISILFLFVFAQIFVSEFMVMQMINTQKEDTKSNDACGPIHFNILFRIIMSVDFAIEQYANHLEDQWSQENFLFFIEALQWLYMVTGQKWDQFNIRPLCVDNIEYNFAKVIPISSINKEDVHWFVKYKKIYKKYVAEIADYQVNLPHDQRVTFEHLIFLWELKQKIDQGTFEPKLIKKSKTQRDKSVISKPTSIKSKSRSLIPRLKSFRRNKSVQKMKPNVIEEGKITLNPAEHIKYSKSLQAYNKKTVNDLKPVHQTGTVPVLRAKSADPSGTHHTSSDITIDLHKKASHEASGPSNNFSVTITDVDENENKSEDIEKRIKTQESIDLEDLYMGVINGDDSGAVDASDTKSGQNTELPPMKSVSFADAIVSNEVDARGHRKSGTVIEHDDTPMNSGSFDSDLNNKNVSESFEAFLAKDASAESVTNDAAATKSQIENRKLSDIKEETNPASSPPKQTVFDAQESKLDDFLAHVHEGIDTEKGGNNGMVFQCTSLEKKTTSHSMHSAHSTHSLGINLLTLSHSLEEPVPMEADTTRLTSTGTISTMETNEWNAKHNLHSNLHRRKGKTGMSSFIGLGLSRLGTLLTPKSTSRRLSEFVEDEEAQSIWEIDPVDKRNMRDAKELNVQHFVTAICEAVSAVLRLNRDLVARFKSTKYWQILNENVDLEELVKEYQEYQENLMTMK